MNNLHTKRVYNQKKEFYMKSLFRRYSHTLILFLIFVITLFLFAAICYIHDFSEETTSLFTFVSAVFFTTLSGIISGKKADEKGWLHGFKGGMIFTVLIISAGLVSSGGNINYSMMTGRIILYIFASLIGGIMGINLK